MVALSTTLGRRRHFYSQCWVSPAAFAWVEVSVFEKPDLAEESGHARFESFPSPQHLAVRDFLRGFRPQIWAALLGLSRVLAHAQLLWPEVQRQRLPTHE